MGSEMTAVAGLADGLTQLGRSLHLAHQRVLARMYSAVIVKTQAVPYVEVYGLLAVAPALIFLLSFLLTKNKPGAGGEVSMH
jgi:hypothetical protein